MGEGAEVVEDYRASGLSLRAHPLAFLRDELRARKMITCEELQSVKDGRWINLAGVVLVRQKPGSAKGVMFITLEDRSEEHTSELQSLMRISYAVFCLKKKITATTVIILKNKDIR